jgi:hypothetical protein
VRGAGSLISLTRERRYNFTPFHSRLWQFGQRSGGVSLNDTHEFPQRSQVQRRAVIEVTISFLRIPIILPRPGEPFAVAHRTGISSSFPYVFYKRSLLFRLRGGLPRARNIAKPAKSLTSPATMRLSVSSLKGSPKVGTPFSPFDIFRAAQNLTHTHKVVYR